MNRLLVLTVLGASVLAAATALAGEGYVVGGTDLRAGPDGGYPSVGTLNAGTPVAIEGCVNGWSWCDVGTPIGRGWVAGSDLQEEYQGARVLVPDYGPRIGIVFVTFDFGSYWDANYRNRPWYGERQRYSQIRPQFRSVSVNVNMRTQPSHGPVRNPHGPANHGVEPVRPGTTARAPARGAAHPGPEQAKSPSPKAAEGDRDKGDKGSEQR